MSSTPGAETAGLRRALARLGEERVVPKAAAALAAGAEATLNALRTVVLAEIPAFSASANPAILPGLAAHAADHVEEIRRLFAGGRPDDFEFLRAHARQRAEQRFPLEATLHAYRLGHRVLSPWLREAALAALPANSEAAIAAVADFAIEYTDAVSTIAAGEYVSHTRLLAEAESDQRTELLNILLSGYDESDGRVARLLKRAGYLEQRQSYCVVLAQPVNAGEMDNPARGQRLVAALAEALAGTSIRVLAGIRNNVATAILADKRRQSGWTAPETALAERVRPLLLVLGPAILIGISADHPSTSFLPKALQEASIALDLASVGNRVVPFAELPIRELLVHRAAAAVQATPPRWATAFFAADAKAEGALIATLRAIADADLNMQQAARALGRHANTLYTRLDRIRQLTGLDGQRYRDLTELLLAADCWRR